MSLPVTPERAISAGSIPDVPHVCDGVPDGEVDGRRPFLPMSATAVNSGFSVVAGHSLSGAAAAP